MSPKISAGLLMYRTRPSGTEVFIVHPGGPYWINKDVGAWSIPKGEVNEGEDPFDTAQREFQEETGITPPTDSTIFTPLQSIKQKSGKIVYAWAFEHNWEGTIKSNLFEMEWPPGSGRMGSFPEADRGEFFTMEEARTKLNPAQVPFLDRLTTHLDILIG